MDDTTSGAVNWLLSSAEPAVRMLARRDLRGQDTAHDGDVLAGPKVRARLSGQHEDSGFGVRPYREWTGGAALLGGAGCQAASAKASW